MSERRFHTDSRTDENFTKDGLETLTGQPSKKWGRYVVKELVDNALEAVEESGTDSPKVSVDMDIADAGHIEYVRSITVSDNGDGIPESQIEKIIDVDHFGGTKRHYALPTRGTQGNALMTILGIQHLASGVMSIETRGRTYEFDVNANTVSGSPTVDFETKSSTAAVADGGVSTENGTTVTVDFGDDAGQQWAKLPRIAETLLGFVSLNPHVSFDLPFGVNQAAKDTTTRYEPKGSSTSGRVHWFDQQAFAERVKADIRAEPSLKLTEFVGEFEGLASRKNRRQAVKTAMFSTDATLKSACTTGDQIDGLETDRLHAAMKKQTDKRAKSGLDSTLGSVGDSVEAGTKAYLEHFNIADIGQLVADLQSDGHDIENWRDLVVSYQTTGAYKQQHHRIPFVFEIAVLPLPLGTDDVHHNFGINQSVSYSSPRVSVEFSGSGGKTHSMRSIASAFEQQEHGFVVVSNLTCPNIPFKDKGKQNFPTEPFEDGISDAVGKAVRKYQRDLRPKLNKLAEDNTSRPTLDDSKKAPHGFIKNAVFELFDRVYQNATEGGTYTITMRQLFYEMRPAFQSRVEIEGYEYTSGSTIDNKRRLELNYDTFTGYVDEYEQEELGERVVHRDDRGFFVEPHSDRRIELSTQKVTQYDPSDAVEMEYDTLLFVEKTGYYKQLHDEFEITKRYDIGLINAQGYSTTAIRNLIEKIQAVNPDVTLLTLTDLDINGLGIATDANRADDLSNTTDEFDAQRIGVTLDDVEKYGLTVESANPKKSQLTKLDNRHEDGEIADDVYKFLRSGKRVEINAFAPTELKAYVEEKLETFGIGKIEPDETDIETPEVDEWNNVREKAIKEGIAEYVMEQVDDHLIDAIESHDNAIELPDDSDRETTESSRSDVFEELLNRLSDKPAESWESVNTDIVEDHTETVEDQQDSYKETATKTVKDVLDNNEIINIDTGEK